MALVETAKFPSAIATEADMLNWKNVTANEILPTLAVAIAATNMTITLAAGTGIDLPADHFSLTIDNEVISITSRSTDTLTVGARGAEGTVAASHSVGAQAQHMVTAKAHNQIVSEVNAIEGALGISLANVVLTSSKNAANGVAPLDSGAKVPTANLPTTVEYNTNKGAASGYAPLDSTSRVPTANLPTTTEYNTNKGAVNGYAGLDSLGRVPVAQLPDEHTIATTITGATTLTVPLPRGAVYQVNGGSAGSYTITLPDAGTVKINEITFIRIDAGSSSTSITATGSQTINGVSSYVLVDMYQFVRLVSVGSNWLIVGKN